MGYPDGDTHGDCTTASSPEGTSVETRRVVAVLGKGRAFSGDGEFMLIGGQGPRATHTAHPQHSTRRATLTEATRGLAERMGAP
ncbi:MAG: hypothetical protein U5J64_05945 [Halobacteriales archaeon]|nr:hypothetical protein [Halobacteriales archaeon]